MKTKKQIASKMMSAKERAQGRPLFASYHWMVRSAKKRLKVIQRVKRATIRRIEREIATNNGGPVKYSL